MEDDIQLLLDTPCFSRVQQLMEELACDFDDAFARVTAKWLDAGYDELLLYWLKRGREPGEVLRKYLAALMVPERRARLPLTNIQYEFRLVPNRKAGRQKRDEQGISRARAIEFTLAAGAEAMMKGVNPGKHFWRVFRYALRPEDFPTDKGRFPWKAKLARIDGQAGRRKNPEPADDVRAWFVEKHRSGVVSYRSAIDKAHNELKGHEEEHKKSLEKGATLKKGKRWSAGISKAALRNAYDKKLRS
ncbi:MAG: hypothetical protein WA441_13435 [Methyloceanibacter sp.]